MPRIVMLVHEEDGRFGASFPDLPGCTTVARDVDTLLAKAPEVVTFHLEGLAEDGAAPPSFRTLGEWRHDGDFCQDSRDGAVVLLEIEPPGRVVRVNISVDGGTLARIDLAAKAAGESRSGFLVAAARHRLATAS